MVIIDRWKCKVLLFRLLCGDEKIACAANAINAYLALKRRGEA